MKGRILFYNPHTGKGKLILESEKKFDFSVEIWNDFDQIPNLGGLVECQIENDVLKGIKALPLQRRIEEDRKAASPDPLSKESIPQDRAAQIEEKRAYHATFSVEETIKNYFKPIDILIGQPPEIVNTKAQLDYFLIKRFLMTAYNDLKGLDPTLHNNVEIKKILEEIQQFQNAYTKVQERLDTPKLAFEMIFLRSQPEYLRFIRHKENCLNRISILSQIEVSLFPDIQQKEEALKMIPPSDSKQREALEKELKSLRRYYVDSIHENAGLSEELSSMEDIKSVYTDWYLESFVVELLKRGGQYRESLKNILNYRAFDLDALMWRHSGNSKMIREFFETSNIEGEYSTMTFLRYHLKTLDKSKINEEQKELFRLLDYLEAREK